MLKNESLEYSNKSKSKIEKYNILSNITQDVEKFKKKDLRKILWDNNEKKLEKKNFLKILRDKKTQKSKVTWILGFKEIEYLIELLK